MTVTGAIGALSADMGLPPRAARGLAILSRTGGLLAEALEEQRDPQAMGDWDLIQDETAHAPPGDAPGEHRQRPRASNALDQIRFVLRAFQGSFGDDVYVGAEREASGDGVLDPRSERLRIHGCVGGLLDGDRDRC